MDSWSDTQLKKMRAGGNADLNAFLKKHGVDKHLDPRVKYNSPAAGVFRDKVSAHAEGRAWTCPPDIPHGPIAGGGTAAPPPRRVGTTGVGESDNDWGGSWGREGGSGSGANVTNRAARPGQEYTMEDYNRSEANKKEYFKQQQALNATRPEGVRPSEGGKYVGFGSGAGPPARNTSGVDGGIEDLFGTTLGTLGTGLASITSQLGRATVSAGRIAGATLDQAGRAANQAVGELQSGDMDMDRVRDRAADVARNGVEMGKQTWTGIKSMLRAGVNQLESLANDDIASGLRRHAGGAGLARTSQGWGEWGDDGDDDAVWGDDDVAETARRVAENAAQPADVRPSEGGRYDGFGSSGSAVPAAAGTWVREVVGAGGTFGGWEDEDNDDGTMHATSEVEGEAKATETAREEKGGWEGDEDEWDDDQWGK